MCGPDGWHDMRHSPQPCSFDGISRSWHLTVWLQKLIISLPYNINRLSNSHYATLWPWYLFHTYNMYYRSGEKFEKFCNKFYNGYECIICLGKNLQILTNFIMHMNVRNNSGYLWPFDHTSSRHMVLHCFQHYKFTTKFQSYITIHSLVMVHFVPGLYDVSYYCITVFITSQYVYHYQLINA